MSDYPSWDSLTDRTWSGRHLPAASQEGLPPVEAVADLFRRRAGAAERRSTRTSMVFPCFAQWLTDGFLRTSFADPRRNTSNHEIDLSPLYGLRREETELVREKRGGRLKSQVIDGGEYMPFLFEEDGETVRAEFRGLPEPVGARISDWASRERRSRLFAAAGDRVNVFAGVAMMQTLFLREHNRVAGELARARGGWDDERLFQTTRNVMIAMFLKIVIEEYINHIAPYHFRFSADPRPHQRSRWQRPNRMAVEFSLVYRWHGLIPERLRVGDREVATTDLLFHSDALIGRGLEGMFADMSGQAAGELGLFSTPEFLIEREANAVRAGRATRLAGYNAYREAVGFPRVTDFGQIHGDAEVARALREVYGTVDRIEFYAGLFAEEGRAGSPLPPLIGRIVGMDAFSQAFTNPLLSSNVYDPETFSRRGWEILEETGSLEDILRRNSGVGGGVRASMELRGG